MDEQMMMININLLSYLFTENIKLDNNNKKKTIASKQYKQ